MGEQPQSIDTIQRVRASKRSAEFVLKSQLASFMALGLWVIARQCLQEAGSFEVRQVAVVLMLSLQDWAQMERLELLIVESNSSSLSSAWSKQLLMQDSNLTSIRLSKTMGSPVKTTRLSMRLTISSMTDFVSVGLRQVVRQTGQLDLRRPGRG